MHLPLISALQAAVAIAPQLGGPSVGEWLAIIGMMLTLGGLIYRAGVGAADNRNVKSIVTEKLAEVSDKLDKIGGFIDDTHRVRTEHAAWRAATDGRIDNLEVKVERLEAPPRRPS